MTVRAPTRDVRVAPLVGVLLAIVSLGLLVYYLHHLARSIQSPHVIMRVYWELRGVIRSLYPQSDGDVSPRTSNPGGDDPDTDAAAGLPPATEAASIALGHAGYLQALDTGRLLRLACDHDLLLHVVAQIDSFILSDQPVLHVWPASCVDSRLRRRLRGAFSVGHHRTPAQDVTFGFQELTEVALRALSPMLNDPFTAIACVHHAGDALTLVLSRREPARRIYDSAGRLRVVVRHPDFGQLVHAALGQVADAARAHPIVTVHVLQTLRDLSDRASTTEQVEAIWLQARRAYEAGLEGPIESFHRTELRRCFHAVAAALGKAVD